MSGSVGQASKTDQKTVFSVEATPGSEGTNQVSVHSSTDSVIPVEGTTSAELYTTSTSTATVKPVPATSGIGNKTVVTGEGMRNLRFGFGGVIAFLGFAVLAL
jgi:hypothetical protein